LIHESEWGKNGHCYRSSPTYPTLDPPRPVGHTSRGRGRRTLVTERPIRAGTATADLTEEDVLEFLVEEITPFVER